MAEPPSSGDDPEVVNKRAYVARAAVPRTHADAGRGTLPASRIIVSAAAAPAPTADPALSDEDVRAVLSPSSRLPSARSARDRTVRIRMSPIPPPPEAVPPRPLPPAPQGAVPAEALALETAARAPSRGWIPVVMAVLLLLGAGAFAAQQLLLSAPPKSVVAVSDADEAAPPGSSLAAPSAEPSADPSAEPAEGATAVTTGSALPATKPRPPAKKAAPKPPRSTNIF